MHLKNRQQGFSLTEMVVIVFILAFLLAILMPTCGRVKTVQIDPPANCLSNLKDISDAMTIYAADSDGQYVCQGKGAAHTWAESTDNWMNPQKDWSKPGGITVGASLYLLVRQADISPKSFVCPASYQKEFTGSNPGQYDVTELWDFGQYHENEYRFKNEGPARCVSYSYHQPYNPAGPATGQRGQFTADIRRPAEFAVMADRNPYYDPFLPHIGLDFRVFTYIKSSVAPLSFDPNPATPKNPNLTQQQMVMLANSGAHEREGQNVLYADGHCSFEERPDVGFKNDNIYTCKDLDDPDSEISRRRGIFAENPDRRGVNETPATIDDSFLVNDFVNAIR